MAEVQKRSTGRLAARGLAVAALAVLAAGIYVSLDGGGNGADAKACAAAVQRAAALDPLAGGEVAAFQVARDPATVAALAFTNAEGQPATLGSFAGKVTLVNLWATWCAPCRQEMPALDRLQAARGGDDFAVVPISIDTTDAERPRAFLDSVGAKNLPLHTDRTTEIFHTLKGRGLALGLPVTLLVDRDGCMLGHINGPAEWDSPEGRKLIDAAIASPAAG